MLESSPGRMMIGGLASAGDVLINTSARARMLHMIFIILKIEDASQSSFTAAMGHKFDSARAAHY